MRGMQTAYRVHALTFPTLRLITSGKDADAESSMKDALRRLYKMVHPDLFSDNHVAQVQNERSFKLLQEYLEQGRTSGGDVPSPASRAPFQFSFFLRSINPENDTRMTPAGGTDSFSHVELTLPPPQLSSYKKGLIKLFRACGIKETLLDDGDSTESYWDRGSSISGSSTISLAAFLPWASEQVRLKEASRSDPALKLANLRGALRLARQVLVSFPSNCDLDSARRVQLLSTLIVVLESVSPHLDLRGCHILLGPAPTGIDRLGHLCLHQDEAVDDWISMLQQVDVGFVRDRLQHVKLIKELQHCVSKSVGLEQIYTSSRHLPEPSYRVFLEGLAHHQQGSGKLGGGRYNQLTLQVHPCCRRDQGDPPFSQPLSNGVSYDEATGIVHCVDDLNGRDVYEWIEERVGDKALLAAKVHASRLANQVVKVNTLRQQLHLKHLIKEPKLSDRHFDSACDRLLIQSRALAPILEGSSLKIGFKTQISSDGLIIELAWDFKD